MQTACLLLLVCDAWPVAYVRRLAENLHSYDILRYDVRVEPVPEGLSVDARVTLRVERPGPLRLLLSSRVQGLRVSAGDRGVPFTFGAGGFEGLARRFAPESADIPFVLSLAPEPALEPGAEATIRVRYTWQPGTGGPAYAGPGRVQTHLYPFWLPAMDRELYDATVEMATPLQALAPGRRTPGPGLWRFESTHPLQVLPLLAGTFATHVRDEGGRRLELLAPPGVVLDAEAVLADAGRLLDLFEEWYGPAAPPEFRIAVEPDPAPGASYCGDSFLVLRRNHLPDALGPARWTTLLAHECAHVWWGHKVATPVLGRGGTWLREGLAQYSGIRAAGALLGAAAERDLWRSQVRGYLGQADLRRAPRAGAVFGNEPTLRDATYLDDPRVAYLRGALVFRILEHVHGPDAFRTALRRWSDAHAYRFADLEDFAREVGPRDLLDYYAGTTRLPDLALEDVRAADGRVRARLTCADASWPGGRVPVRIETEAGAQDLEVEVRAGAGALDWRGAGRPKRIEVDPERLWLDPIRSNSLWE